MKIREEAAASCSKVIGRKVQRKQARRARVSHCVKCSLEPGTKIKRKPLIELFVDGNFTDDRPEWQNELERLCGSVYTELEETKEVQQEGIEYFKGRGFVTTQNMAGQQ